MGEKSSWMKLLAESDTQGLWDKLHWSVAHHNAVKSFVTARGCSYDWMREAYLDMTQDLFVRLLEKDRFRHYLDANYSNETIEHELQHLEIPNLISLRLRNQHPESFRIARRISNILKTSGEFKYFGGSAGRSQAGGRLVSRHYGLACWPASKSTREESELFDLIKNVDFRMRETRKSGRGRSSQIIISNKDLSRLLVEIFNATQSLMNVRTVRLLALSKISVEDSRFVSIDEQIAPWLSSQSEPYRIDFPDKRASPEEVLIDREMARDLDYFADSLICNLKRGVRNKPRRFSKLVRVVWHCYFDPVSRSQGEIAALMGVSDSLVCHYRKLFDSYVRQLQLRIDEWVILNRSIEVKLASILFDAGPNQISERREPARAIPHQDRATMYVA